jgi:DNA transformation protein and related proteins
MAANRDFVDYCLELLSGIGSCRAKRMFGEKLWLKADADSQVRFEAEGCQRFVWTTHKNGAPVQMSMGYYTAPVAALESALVMTPWARMALQSARSAHKPKPVRAAPAKKTRPRRPSNRPPGG